jgi:uncharacterized protein YaiE (UPF0345 family)
MEVKIQGQEDIHVYEDGDSYDVPANSMFRVNVPFQTSLFV